MEYISQQNRDSHFVVSHWITIIWGWCFIIYEYAVRVSDSVILLQLQRSFHLSSLHLSFLSSAYYFAYVLFMIPAGIIIDRFGLYRAWSIAILILIFGCALFAMRIDLTVLFIARILMGIGSSFASIGVFALMLRHKYSGLLIGITMAMGMFGALMGQGPWLQLTHFLGFWAYTYWFATIVGIVLWLFWWWHARNQTLTLVHMHMSSIGNTFLQLFRSPVFWVLALFIGCLSTPQTAFMALWGPRYLTKAYHLTPTLAAYANSLMAIGGLIGAILLGWLGDRYGNIKVILGVIAILTIICMFAIIEVWFANVNLLLLLLLIVGLLTNTNVIVFAFIGKYFYNFSKTTIQGTTNMFNMSGGPVFQIIIGILISLETSDIHTQLSAMAMRKALLAIPIGLIIVTILLLSLSPKKLVME